MSKFIKALSNFVLVLTIIILSLYFILRLANVIKIYNVETGSMEDKIHAGDYILLFRKNNYYVGDVITYRVKKYFITHRIVKIENDKITTKGDANNSEDSEISKNQVEGKVIYWGGILNFVINYKFVIIAFLIGMYLLSCYFGDDEEDSKKKEKKKYTIDLKNIKSQDKETIISDTKEEEIKEKTLIDNNIIKQEEKNIIDVLENIPKEEKEKTSTKKKAIGDKTSEKKKTTTRKKTTKKKETTDKTSEKKKTSTRKTTTKKKETKNTTQTKRAKSSTDKKITVSKTKKSSKTKSIK